LVAEIQFSPDAEHREINNMRKTTKIIVGVIGLLVLGCIVLFSKNASKIVDNNIKVKSGKIMEKINLPKELKEKVVVFGNPESDKVLVNAQGGPMVELDVVEFKSIVNGDAGIATEDMFFVDVHQCQTLETKFYSENEIGFDEAKNCDKESVDTLAKVVEYFKKQNKKVYVLGISFGAFVVEDLLARYDNIADKYIIEVGRLEMPEEVWKKFSEGNYCGFEYDKNGKVKIVPINASDAGMDNNGGIADKNTSRLAAGLGYKRFTELLKDKKMDNVIYVYGNRDEQVGRLTENEIKFLQSKNVKIYEINGDHSETIENFSKNYLKDLLQ